MKHYLAITMLLCVLGACGGDDEASKDMSYPVISDEGIEAVPSDCYILKRGEVMPFHYVFTDDTELGSFNIEIHNNFDHHTHGTSSVECPMEEEKAAVNAWVFNQDYEIPSGLRTYDTQIEIPIPDDVDPGDYHFMIRLTDHVGWQQLRAMAVKIQ